MSFKKNPRAADIAALFYRGEGDVDHITEASFRRVCFMSERQYVSEAEVSHVMAMCDESAPPRRSEEDDESSDGAESSSSEEEEGDEDDENDDDYESADENSDQAEGGRGDESVGGGGSQWGGVVPGGGQRSRIGVLRSSSRVLTVGAGAGARGGGGSGGAGGAAGGSAEEPQDGVMRRVKLRDTLLLCEILRVTYRAVRNSGCGPRDGYDKFREATARVMHNLGDGRNAMYTANYGKRAMKEACRFDFTAMFDRLGAIAARADLAERFRQFSAEGDGRLDASSLRELLLYTDPKLVPTRQSHRKHSPSLCR